MNSSTTPYGHSRLAERRTAHGVAIAFTATLVLAGCSGGATTEEATSASTAASTPTQETVTVTAEASAATTPSSSTTERSTAPAPPQCSPESVPVASDAATIAQPFPDRGWAVWQTGNLCGTLGYAELLTAGGTGSSPTQLLLYNNGEFLGTGIKCNALGQVSGSTADSVTVGYRWPIGDDSNANMRGRATVTYQWNGSSVDMIGDLPAEALPGC